MDVVEYEVQINAELCRCCLAGSDHLNELFRCVTVGSKVLSVSNIYRDVTNLSVSYKQCHPIDGIYLFIRFVSHIFNYSTFITLSPEHFFIHLSH